MEFGIRTHHKSFLITDFGIFLAIFSQNFLEYREYCKKFREKKSKNRAKYGVKKDFKKAVYWNEKASKLKFATATYNIGLFYYAGIADLPQDLIKAKKYWVLSAEQWKNRNEDTTAEGLLEEINQYSSNQTKEMIILRDAYIDFVRDPSSFNLRKLKSI